MAYTPIDKGENFVNTKLYTGNGGTQSITGVGFQPDWTWIKSRSNSKNNAVFDAVRGVTNRLITNTSDAQATVSTSLTAFGTDGFSLGADTTQNANGNTFVAWNWKAAGTAPSNTYAVKVVSDGGNKYRFDDFGASAVTLEISEGGTFTFDQSDSSNNGHPLRFSTTSNGTHGGGSEYTTGVTTNGTPGQAGAYTRITVAASAPTLYYYCTQHSGMGGQANTPVTNSFSNFAGSIQSNISPNTTSKFSIVKFTGTGANATVGHGLGVAPGMIIFKESPQGYAWRVYHQSLANTQKLELSVTNAVSTDATAFNSTSPTSTVFSVGSSGGTNYNGSSMIAYCFADVQGFSKMGSYVGNGNADGTFVYTGFSPAFVMIKNVGQTASWNIKDNRRNNASTSFNINPRNATLLPNDSAADQDANALDFLSNGFKNKSTGGDVNASNIEFIYMAFAENPFTSSTGTPVTAR